MKTTNLLFSLLLLFFIFISHSGYSSHVMGADITYKLIDTNTGKYRFRVTLYRECSGINFGSEYLSIRKSGFSGNVNMTLISRNEVTSICNVPDVSTRPTTNCPSGAVGSNGIGGIERWIYEVDYIMGKNIGFAYVGWSTCCRSASITTGPANEAIWVQATLNTDYQNSSPIFSSDPLLYWVRQRPTSYNPGMVDFDAKYITINGQSVLRDSLSYQLYLPFTAEATNPATAINFGNPTVTMNSPLTATNFLYTTSGVALNSFTGEIKCTPSIIQDPVYGIVIREWRAIPNASGVGYTRVLIGYVCRDLQFAVRDISDPIIDSGIVMDSIDAGTYVNSQTIKTCRTQGVKIVYKLQGLATQNIKIKDFSSIDPTMISNYSMSTQTDTGGGISNVYVTFKFDRAPSQFEQNFNFKGYYCMANGRRIDRYFSVRALFNKSFIGFASDTIYKCVGTGPIRLELKGAKEVKWSPRSGILAAEAIDSSWIDINPSSNLKYYANNLAYGGTCTANDSVFIKLDTCTTLSGKIFVDINKNCSMDATDSLVKNQEFEISGVSSGFFTKVVTDNIGHYSLAIPSNQQYIYRKNSTWFNCNTNISEFTATVGSSSVVKNVPVKDTARISNISLIISTKKTCIEDTIDFILGYTKSFGKVKSFLYFGDGDSTIINNDFEGGNMEYYLKHAYKNADTFDGMVKFYSNTNALIGQYNFSNVIITSCIRGKVYIDLNKNCSFDVNQDTIIKNQRVILNNLTAGTNTILFTNGLGEYKGELKLNTSYKLIAPEIIRCNSGLKTINLPVLTSDSLLKQEIPLSPDSLNYILVRTRSGNISNTDTMTIGLGFNANYRINGISKTYVLTLPAKCKYVRTINGSTTQVANKLYISNSNLSYSYVKLVFDSLISTDTLCFNIRLSQVMQEEDTSDNVISFCSPAFTSYDPNNKEITISSMNNEGNFTDKNDYLHYTVNFQNTGNSLAKDVFIIDKLHKNLDLSTIKIISYSHSMTTSLNDNSELRFDFKNILLPDSNTDKKLSQGYVSFMIKPKSNLQLLDTIQNEANIYFDFNLPILTNMTNNIYVEKKAIVPIKFFNVTISSIPSIGGNCEGAGTYREDTTINLVAHANPNYLFVNWQIGATNVSTDTIYTFKVVSDKNIKGIFKLRESTNSIISTFNSAIKIFPNPAQNFIGIESPTINGKYMIMLYSLDGKEVYKEHNAKYIDLMHLDRGTYILRYFSELENYSQKIILN